MGEPPLGSSRQRDLLPLPIPFPGIIPALPTKLTRCSVRRIHARQAWQSWANSGVLTVNHLYKPNSQCQHTPSRSQTAALDQFCAKYKAMGKPPVDLTPAGALRELCHQSVPYLSGSDDGGPIPFDADLVSLPDVGSCPADPQALISSAH